MVLNATDGVECCCNTARAAMLSEITETGVIRVKKRRQARRLTNTARASQRALCLGSPAWALNRPKSMDCSRSYQ
eukprot:13982223-Alexandrium_andersonii.AAC.1